MPVKTTWIDPNSGKEYSYNWGFDVDSTIPKKKNSADYFGWAVESIENNSEERNIVVTLTGYPKHECAPFSVNEIELERNINNRMNGEEKELETALMRRMSNTMYGVYSNHVNHKGFIIPEIKNVIFNPPATIVFWNDGTKTVVKCQNHEEFDHEKGLAVAFFKKMHGNKGHYFEEIKKWTEKYKGPVQKEVCEDSKWHIWYKIGMLDEIHCYEKDYSTKSSAVKRAKKLCECDDYNITLWTVSQKAPFGPESDDVEWHFN